MRRRMRFCWLAVVLVATAGCASQTARLSQLGLESIEFLRTLPAEARPRIVVAGVLDHTGAENARVSPLVSGLVATETGATAAQFLDGVHSLLVTGMLNTGAFTVLERDDLDELAAERLLRAQSGERIALEQTLEGADLVVAAAVTGFEFSGGFAFPIPLPLSRNGDFGILWLQRSTSSLSLDIRVLDVRTGRIVHSTAVTGRASRFSASLDAYFFFDHGHLSLPGVLGYYNNTPMHSAILEMVTQAVARIGEAASPVLWLDPIRLNTGAVSPGVFLTD